MPMQPLSCRLDHESPIAEYAAHLSNRPQMEGNDQAAPNPNQPVQPAFVEDLSTRLLRMGYDIFDGDFDVPVRTWYIDHATIRRWTAPRKPAVDRTTPWLGSAIQLYLRRSNQP